MADISTVLLIVSSAFAVCAVYALYRSQRLRADLDRSSEGSMLGAEFGAFTLPQAELAPDAQARRHCRSWAACAIVAMSLSCIAAVMGLLV
ncbi:MAG: hypothetical protein AAF499_12170 [Pseudomonadota bacterium]